MARYALVRDADGAVVNICEWDGDTKRWQPPAGHSARLAADDEGVPSKPPLTDDERVAQRPARERLKPTSAAPKAALRDLLDEQVRDAQAWEWFATKCAADANLPAGAKADTAALATAEYTRAKRLLQAWRQAN